MRYEALFVIFIFFHSVQAQQVADDQFNNVVRIVAGVSAILSVLGSTLIIISSLRRDLCSSLAHRLIFFLSLADLLASLTYILHLLRLDKGDVCIVSAFIMNTFELSSVFWSSCICCHLLLSLLFPKNEEEHVANDTNRHWFTNMVRAKICSFNSERMEAFYHLISWGYPFAWSVAVLANKRFGDAGNWCWIINDQTTVFGWRFFTFMPIYILMFFNITVFIIAIIVLRLMMRNSSVHSKRRTELKALFRLSMFFIAFIVTWILPFSNRIAELMNRYNKILEIGQALTNPLQGFLNMILYGACTQKCLTRVRRATGKICPCCAISEEEQPILMKEEESSACCFPCCRRQKQESIVQPVDDYVGAHSDDEEERPVQKEAAVILPKDSGSDDFKKQSFIPASTFYDSSQDDEGTHSEEKTIPKVQQGHKRYPSWNDETGVQVVPVYRIKKDSVSVADTIDSGAYDDTHSVDSEFSATQNEISRIITRHKERPRDEKLATVKNSSTGTRIYASSND